MTTISPNRKRTAARLQFFSFAVLLLAVVGVVALARDPLASLLWRVGSPLSHLRDTAFGNTGIFFSSFTSNRALVIENNRLRAELASTSLVLMDRNILLGENSDLKNRLGRLSPAVSSVLASVLLRPPGSPYDTLVIDVGRSEGVEPGDLVAAGGSVYIGTVREVYATTARVELFSAPGESYSALLVDSVATTTLAISVAGQGAGSLTAEVPAGTSVRVGDSVLFPNIMPQLAATVVQVDEKNQASFKTIYMQLPVSINSLRYVEVHRQHPATHNAQ